MSTATTPSAPFVVAVPQFQPSQPQPNGDGNGNSPWWITFAKTTGIPSAILIAVLYGCFQLASHQGGEVISKIDELVASQNKMSASVDRMSASIDRMSGTMGEMNIRLSTIETQLRTNPPRR